jgi:phage FluMu protein Com
MAVAVRAPAREREASVLETWRCAGCGRIVAKFADLKGRIEVKCRCGSMNTMVIR